MEKLRDEILHCESTRSVLLKWKLAVVGVVGAAGLGFSGSTRVPHAVFVLCVIPPVAVYVDLLCRHLALKMLVIGTFLAQWRGGNDPARVFSSYESWAMETRVLKVDKWSRRRLLPWNWKWNNFLEWLEEHFVGRKPGPVGAFDLEDWALSISTVALSLALVVFGPVYGLYRSWDWSALFALSGAAGLVATAIGNRQYVRRYEATRHHRTDLEAIEKAQTESE